MSSVVSIVQSAYPSMVLGSVYDAVTSFPGAACRKFEDVTDAVCSPVVANVVKNAVYAMPVTLASLFLPLPIKLAALIVYASTQILFKDVPNEQTKFSLCTGLGNASIIRAGINTVGLLQTGKAAFAVAAGINLLWAALWHSTAKSYVAPERV